MTKRVAILGGGIGGLTAAQELIERGFEVTVFELKDIPGGKARSIPVPGSGKDGRRDLPGEHGFRFFPGFYRHLPDTMQRIPFGEGRCVYDNLVTTTRVQIARTDQSNVFTPVHFPASIDDVAVSLKLFLNDDLGISMEEKQYFAEKLMVLLTSCKERRFAEYEAIDWWSFVDADRHSEAFQNYCADGLTRCLVALKARQMSTRTGGYILLQLMMDLAEPGSSSDRILTGPTNDVWLTPWYDYLTGLGVEFQFHSQVTGLDYSAGRVTGATVRVGESEERIDADYFVSAMPVEVFRAMLTQDMKQAAPSLANLEKLKVAWMVGIQFYMDRDVSVAKGHSLYIDSPWALTSISQKQFWPDVDLSQFGNGQVKDILSVDVSDWDTPGILYNKTARECTPDEIKDEVFAQILAHISPDDKQVLKEARILDWFLDPAIVHTPDADTANLEPLLINTNGSWEYRPEAVTEIENLFLAADYVRTNTDLATMEAANEAARRAVNGILKACGSRAKPCRIWPLKEVRTFGLLRWYDSLRFKRGLPHDMRPVRTVMRFPQLMTASLGAWRMMTGRRRK